MGRRKRSRRSDNLPLGDPATFDNVNTISKQLLKKYEIDMSVRELSEGTIRNYLADLKQWMRYIYLYQENKSVKKIDEDEIVQFLYFAKASGNGTRRNRRRASSISAFYKFLRRKRIIDENPMEFLERSHRDVDVYTQTFLSKQQVRKMRSELEKCGNLQLRVYALLSLSTMARVTAISSLRWEQCQMEDRIFVNVKEKEGKIVTLYFNNECKELLQELQKQRESEGFDDHGYVFSTGNDAPVATGTLNQWAHRVGEMIDVPELHPHDFRHTGANLLKQEGMKLEDVSSLLNHASTDVTKKFYLREDRKKIRALKDQFEI